MKKPKKSGSDYYNYNGFFSLVLLALVNEEYRFMWIECWSSGFCSDAQIFNRSDLREKIEDGSFGLLASEPLGDRGQDLHYFLLGNNRISRGKRVVENVFRILVSRLRVLLGTMGQKPRVVRDIVFMCVVLHNMLRSHQGGGGGADRAPTPANDLVALQNKQAMYVPNENYRNHFREASHMGTSITWGHWLGRTGSEMCQPTTRHGHLLVLVRTT